MSWDLDIRCLSGGQEGSMFTHGSVGMDPFFDEVPRTGPWVPEGVIGDLYCILPEIRDFVFWVEWKVWHWQFTWIKWGDCAWEHGDVHHCTHVRPDRFVRHFLPYKYTLQYLRGQYLNINRIFLVQIWNGIATQDTDMEPCWARRDPPQSDVLKQIIQNYCLLTDFKSYNMAGSWCVCALHNPVLPHVELTSGIPMWF